MELSELRKRIDALDEELVKLFCERMRISSQVAESKRQTGKAVFDPVREREIVRNLTENLDEEMAGYVSALYNTVFEISRARQSKMLCGSSDLADRIKTAKQETPEYFPAVAKVACQGTEGAYSQKACEKLFRRPDISYADTFKGVFRMVESGECKYGILPLENSIHGTVGEVYDLLKEFKNKVHIVRGVRIPIHHVLLGKNGADLSKITQVYSHAQAIGQCSEFLALHPEINVNVCKNTAVAAKMVSESNRDDVAAISSYDCASLYGLSVLAEDLQNSDNNHTRFICISKELEIYPGSSRMAVMFTVPHRAGSLVSILSRFNVIGVNLSKLESRPIKGRDFEFMFYAEIESYGCDEDLISYLCELDMRPEELVFLGNYIEI